jgi:integrase
MTEQLVRRQRRKTLTDLMVKNLRKKAARYTVPDPELGGHYIRVMPAGSNVYCAVAREPSFKRQVWHTIGSADVLDIAAARELACAAIGRIKKGLPAVEPTPVKPDSFESVAGNWLKRHVAKEKLRTQTEIERCLSVYIPKHWKSRPFASIRRSDVARLLDIIEDKNGPRQADVVLGILRSIAAWYATRNDDYLSPFMRGMRRSKAEPRERTLKDPELAAVWKAAEAGGSFGALIRILLLTGQRRGAVLGMRWDDLSADGVWEIQSEEREKGNAGALKLPAQALAIINTQPRISGNPYVFAAARGDGPLNSFSKAKRAFDKRCGVAGWTLHDCRRTARSLMSRVGVSSEHAERVLGHAIGGVKGVYDRHAYFDEKADALARLASLIETIINPPTGNVLPLRQPAAQS